MTVDLGGNALLAPTPDKLIYGRSWLSARDAVDLLEAHLGVSTEEATFRLVGAFLDERVHCRSPAVESTSRLVPPEFWRWAPLGQSGYGTDLITERLPQVEVYAPDILVQWPHLLSAAPLIEGEMHPRQLLPITRKAGEYFPRLEGTYREPAWISPPAGNAEDEQARIACWPPIPAEEPGAAAAVADSETQVVASDRTGAPGRPTLMHLVEAEMRRRAESGGTCASLADEAVVLEEWCKHQHPTFPTPTAKTISNRLRAVYKGLK